jgi:predicted transcriptional regulator
MCSPLQPICAEILENRRSPVNKRVARRTQLDTRVSSWDQKNLSSRSIISERCAKRRAS